MLPRVVNVSAKALATVAGPVTSWQTPNGPFNVEHLAGVNGAGDVIVFFWSPQHDWQAVDVSSVSGQKLLPGTSLCRWQTPNGPFNVEHVAGVSAAGDLIVFFWSPQHDWQAVNVSLISGGRLQAGAPVTAWQTPNGPFNVEHVAGVDPMGDLIVFFWSPQHDWQAVDASGVAGVKLSLGTAVTSWQTPDGPLNVEHVAGVSDTGDLQVFFWSPRHDWQAVNASQIAGRRVQPAAGLASWQTPDGPFNVEHVAGVSDTGDLQVFLWSPRHDWQAVNVSAVTSKRLRAVGNGYQRRSGYENVEYVFGEGLNGEAIVFSWTPSTDWVATDFAQFGVPPIDTAPEGWLVAGTAGHLAGRARGGALLVIWWNHATAIVTNRYSQERTGANHQETDLNAGNVRPGHFGLLFRRPVDGQVYAQPLYVPDVAVPGFGIRNVLYVATMHNTVFAFDADHPLSTAPLWQTSLGAAIPLPDPQIGPPGYSDISPSPSSDPHHPLLPAEVGVLSTPVISLAARTLFVVAATKEGGKYFHRLHALDIATGHEQPNSPVVVAQNGSESLHVNLPGGTTGDVLFESHRQLQRSGLALANGRVYVAFASYGDMNDYHGWVVAFEAQSLARREVFCTTPGVAGGDNARGGIWQAGQAGAVDHTGNLYYLTGNGGFDSATQFSDAILKLSPDLHLVDWFSPFNNLELNLVDADLGASGAMLVPGTDLLLAGGKESKLYLMHSSALGHFALNDQQIVQSFYVQVDQWNQLNGHHIHGGPIYWSTAAGTFVYVWPENAFLKQFRFLGQKFDQNPAFVSTTTDPNGVPGGTAGMPGGMMSVSSDGGTPNSGVVWASHPWNASANQNVVPGVLRAYDASDVRREIWNSQMTAARDAVGFFAKFSPPTIANGRVYQATFSGYVAVYGLLA
jgi:hypothetical protein